jgi:C2 domain
VALEPESIDEKMKKVENVKDLGIPPSIKLEMKQLKIDVYRGANIASLDPSFLGIIKTKSDPYVEFNYGGMIKRTKTVKSSANPGMA